MKVALAQIANDPAFVDQNVANIKRIILEMEYKADIVVFPELSIAGYIPLDLVLSDDFVEKNMKGLDEIVAFTADKTIVVVVGFISTDPYQMRPDGIKVRKNSIAVIHNGKIVLVKEKNLMPEYDIFYEKRYFTSGKVIAGSVTSKCEPVVVGGEPIAMIRFTDPNYGTKNIGFLICEDAWDSPYTYHPALVLKKKMDEIGDRIDTIISCNASPFHVNKIGMRIEVIKRIQKMIPNCDFIYVNRVGSIDGYDGEILFDGQSLCMDGVGHMRKVMPTFQESVSVYDDADILSYDVKELSARNKNEDHQLFDAITYGVKEYFRRSGFRKALIGLSGGIDSALVAAIAVKALGKENVIGVTMPSKHSSKGTKNDAEILAKNLGIEFHDVSIQGTVDVLKHMLGSDFGELKDLTQQNIQARIRGNLLMAISNEKGYLVLSTGNKTEMALGYCTLYGDMSGGLAVIADLNKKRVYDLARYFNQKNNAELIPFSTIERAPSAELTDNQTDENSIGISYDILSPLVDEIVEGHPMDELLSKYKREDIDKVRRLIGIAEYKRRQAPPAIKVTTKAFGIGRRIPMFTPTV